MRSSSHKRITASCTTFSGATFHHRLITMTATIEEEYQYDDSLICAEASQTLWRMVLRQSIDDALGRSIIPYKDPLSVRTFLSQSRSYILSPNRDFAEVCSLAGLDPDAVRDRLRPVFEANPIETLVSQKGKRRKNAKSLEHRGVVSNLKGSKGTGAGSTLQDTV